MSVSTNVVLLGSIIILSCTINTNYLEKPIIVIIPSYNNSRWYTYNLDSVFNQEYTNYKVIYIDDCSQDNTAKLVEAYVKHKKQELRFLLLKHKKRKLKVYNLYKAIHKHCADDAIIIDLDGDDWFGTHTLFSYINELYNRYDIWLTYGTHQKWPSGIVADFMVEISPEIIKNNSFRRINGNIWCALRTYYAWLFKLIDRESLLYKNSFLPMTGDAAIMLPMFEMAGERFFFIKEPVYVHNIASPLNDHKINWKLQTHLEKYIRNQESYKRLDKSVLRDTPSNEAGSIT